MLSLQVVYLVLRLMCGIVSINYLLITNFASFTGLPTSLSEVRPGIEANFALTYSFVSVN